MFSITSERLIVSESGRERREIIIQERQNELDIAKGIGIILVVWAHAQGPFSNYINGFHMPFFFFLSGMLYQKKGRSIKDYIVRKCRSLLIPFWFWNLLLYPVYFIMFYWREWNPRIAVKDIAEIVITVNKVPFLGASWFLPALFWVSIFVHVFLSMCEKFKYSDCILLAIWIAIALFGFFITFPFRISRNMICGLFYVLGYLYKKYIKRKNSIAENATVAITCIIFYVFCIRINAISMGTNTYKYKSLFVLGALAAIYFMIWISELLDRTLNKSIIVQHLSYLGKNSIDIVIWQFLAFRITIVVQMLALDDVGIKALTAFPVFDSTGAWWIVYIITGIYGSILWKYILGHNLFSERMRRFYLIN